MERKIPQFTEFEMKELLRRARSSSYFEDCRRLVIETVLDPMFDNSEISERQLKWLWKIKRDLSGANTV